MEAEFSAWGVPLVRSTTSVSACLSSTFCKDIPVMLKSEMLILSEKSSLRTPVFTSNEKKSRLGGVVSSAITST